MDISLSKRRIIIQVESKDELKRFEINDRHVEIETENFTLEIACSEKILVTFSEIKDCLS